MNYSEKINEMAQCILEYIKKSIDTRSYSDKTFKAKITMVVSEDKYKVLYCGNTYTVSSSILCEVGDTVRVCAPCNNWQELYIVENRTKGKTLRDIQKSITTINDSFSNINNSISNINTSLNNKSEIGHIHDDRYYTEDEMNVHITNINYALSNKSDTWHNHNGVYQTPIKITDVGITITQDQWITSGSGQKYFNSVYFSSLGITGTVIDCFIKNWHTTAHHVTCSAYDNAYIQFRAEYSGVFNGTIRIIWI